VRKFVVVMLGVMLTGCGAETGSNSIGNDEVAKGDSRPQPGRYKFTEISEITRAEAGFPGAPQTGEICYSDPIEESLLVTSGMSCTRDEVSIEKGHIDATMTCTAPGTAVQDARLEIRGSYDASEAEVTGDVVLPQGMIRLTKKVERIGDC
jgi:hypothetical protein